MAEHGIIFSGEMVRAILAGRKTQTRRVIKPQPTGRVVSYDATDGMWYSRGDARHIDWLHKCPRGKPGDRLWVRETWAVKSKCDGVPPVEIPPQTNIWYKASTNSHLNTQQRGRWRSPIHMPRWASRITLEVTVVRVERVRSISPADVSAEGTPGMIGGQYGCRKCNNAGWTFSHPDGCDACGGTGVNPSQHFADLWDSINGKKYPWESNPWIWILEFKEQTDG